MAMMSGEVQSLFLQHWCQVWLSSRPVDFSSNSLLRHFETVLELFAVRFKRKIARMFLQELFGEPITIRLTER